MNEFDKWNTLKQNIHTTKSRIHFRQGEIWFISIGQNIGYEVYGKGEQFLRPVLVFRKINKNTFLAIPLTSKIKDDRFHCQINFKEKTNSAILTQIKTIDSKRLLYKSGILNKIEFKNVENAFVEFYNLTSPKRGGYTHKSEQRVNEQIISKED